MQYIDFKKPKSQAARKLTTRSHSNYRMANPPDLLPTVTTFKGFKVQPGITAKENHRNRPMAISMLGTRTDPSHLALHTTFKLHATSK